MRVIVCGGRNFQDRELCFEKLDEIIGQLDNVEIVSGAGLVRNKEMYKYALEDEPMVIAFWDGESKGTKSMIDIASKDGAKVHVVEI